MDNNQVPQPTTAAWQTPAQPNIPISPATAPMANKKSANKLWIILVAVGLLLILGVVGYLYMGNLSKSQPGIRQATDVSDIQKELDSVSVEDLESDFADVDRDLQSL